MGAWLPRRSGVAGLALVVGLSLTSESHVPSEAFSPPRQAQWDKVTGIQLLVFIEHIGEQGLIPSNYGPDAVRSAIESGEPSALEASATRSFGLVARDLARGRIAADLRGRYFIPSDAVPPQRVAKLLAKALAHRNVGEVLNSLSPHDMQYKGLVAELDRLTPHGGWRRETVILNLERRRWLTRAPSANRIEINIPEYKLRLLQEDREVASFRVIAGKPRTPTPQFEAKVTGVIFNPSWQVPRSIIAESIGRLVRRRAAQAQAKGFVWSDTGNGLKVMQQPGPGNALGQVKFDMPNPFSVYLHDTPDKLLFDRERRAFSHGCIRVDRPLDLAALLLGLTGTGRADLELIVSSHGTERRPLAPTFPIMILYQTAVVGEDGVVRYLEDPYDLDRGLAARLRGEVANKLP